MRRYLCLLLNDAVLILIRNRKKSQTTQNQCLDIHGTDPELTETRGNVDRAFSGTQIWPPAQHKHS